MSQRLGRGWVRVIAGTYRGTRLVTLPGREVRPTADRLRESLFAVLGDRVAAASVVDCFAGTGALGIEALSRGAARALFVEREPRVATVLRDNLARLPGEPPARVVTADALSPVDWNTSVYPADLVFADPPYRQGLGERLLAALAKTPVVGPQGLVILEHERGAEPVQPSWVVVDRRRVGDTVVSFYVPRATGRDEERA